MTDQKYVYVWTPDGKLRKGVPKYANGNGWEPLNKEDGSPIYVNPDTLEEENENPSNPQ